MSSDRWATIERLSRGALASSGRTRGIPRGRLRGRRRVGRDVESLLAQDASGAAALTRGAVAAAVSLVSNAGQSALTGRRVGVYQVLAPIGAGVMGEVYRARDTRLGRDVAIKILPRAFTDDPDRLARFEREARVLASFNHPNIATIHGIEDPDGVRDIVMELVEGETLADRIARRKSAGLPMSEALDIARQIADALDAAHEKGPIRPRETSSARRSWAAIAAPYTSAAA